MYTATTKHISSPKRRGSEIKRLFYGNKAFIKRDVTYLLNEDETEDVKVDIELLKPKKSWRKKKRNPGHHRRNERHIRRKNDCKRTDLL